MKISLDKCGYIPNKEQLLIQTCMFFVQVRKVLLDQADILAAKNTEDSDLAQSQEVPEADEDLAGQSWIHLIPQFCDTPKKWKLYT